ncbi:polymerase suppressor [Dissophora globulifera]|uniref:Polymerase suppressor n=1 Tax=Dissophora globulifera TaxID=979702 RepID=A0A9P6R4F2_9FUNG|nr:polymerase suppressor [Dissophora globulifera]
MSSSNKIISTTDAPKALGPYAQAIVANGFVFLSGALGVDPKTGQLAEGLEAQTEQAFTNIKALLKESNSSMSQVVKATVFLKDLNDFNALNVIYAKHFGGSVAARSCVEVARLPLNAVVEIECIATVSA